MTDGEVLDSSEPIADSTAPWLRLSSRMIWVDALQMLLSLAPGVIAAAVVGAAAELSTMWPFLAVAVFGVFGAASDAWRWVFTRYRVTAGYVELRTGVLVRRYRSVRRDRIRSVDVTARLRHRLSGLRVVAIGAGQQAAAGESAFDLDAVLAADARQLQRILLRGHADRLREAPAEQPEQPEQPESPEQAEQLAEPEVLARFQPRWVVYNLVNAWAIVLAAGVLWGGFWMAATVGIDLFAVAGGVVDWQQLGWGARIGTGAAVVAVVGVGGMALTFFTSHWNFELSRVLGGQTTLLRTRQGLFHTKEVNRDEARIRGISLSEPVLWRPLGITDTTVITTGLDAWAASDPTTILPRGPRSAALQVSSEVLRTDPTPVTAELARHPARALRRRIWWAALTTAVLTVVLGWLALTDVLPGWLVWLGAGLLPIAVLGAVIAYRALGHAIDGEYVVFRSGLVSRTTVALRRDAVSTVALRESLLQRRLGLQTVAAMTAAGDGVYEAPDVAAPKAAELANSASNGLLEPFLVPGRPPAGGS